MLIPQKVDRFGPTRAPRTAFWKTIPRSARIIFYAGVFALFASIGFMSLAINTHYLAPFQVVATVLIMGGFAIVYASASIARRYWLIPVIGIVQGALFAVLNGLVYGNTPQLIPPDSPLQGQLTATGLGSIVSVIAGYTLFVVFFAKQGSQLFRAQTEITLAGEIHRALVPTIERKLGDFELYGASVPSGVVGGDLVDVMGDAEAWTAYIADVSGHGVSAGLLMAMFKTSVRTHAGGVAPEVLLEKVNRALYPLKTNNTFVTAGVLHRADGKLSVALAGHGPLVCYRKRTQEVEEYPPRDMPVGIMAEQAFSATIVACERGDILLLVTDGLTEVFDASGAELGLAPIKSALAESADLPLPELFRRLRDVAVKTGAQLDDQTMLIVRCG